MKFEIKVEWSKNKNVSGFNAFFKAWATGHTENWYVGYDPLKPAPPQNNGLESSNVLSLFSIFTYLLLYNNNKNVLLNFYK